MDIYLQPTYFLDLDHPRVLEKAHQTAGRLTSPETRAQALFYEVRDNCHYNMYKTSFNREDYRASSVLAAGEGFCLQKAILLASLARAVGIPSRLVIVAMRNHKTPPEAQRIMGSNVFFPHTYNQFYLQGRWISAAAPFERSICARINVPAVEFDGCRDALLPSQDFDGAPYIEYMEHFGYFDDVPLEWIMQTMPEFYGENLQEKWRPYLK